MISIAAAVFLSPTEATIALTIVAIALGQWSENDRGNLATAPTRNILLATADTARGAATGDITILGPTGPAAPLGRLALSATFSVVDSLGDAVDA